MMIKRKRKKKKKKVKYHQGLAKELYDGDHDLIHNLLYENQVIITWDLWGFYRLTY